MFSGKQQLFLAITFLMINRQCDPDSIRYSFSMEWFDAEAALVRPYYLFYFPADGSIELFDTKNGRTFLKRTRVEGLTLDQLHEGANVHIFGRLMTVVAFGDEFTRNKLGVIKQRTFAMVKPDAVSHMGEIVQAILRNGFTINKLKLTRFSDTGAATFYGEHKDKSFFEPLMQFVTSGPVLAMELVAENAVARWRELIGPTDSAKARASAPESLRALYGTDTTFNAVHGSDSPASAAREVALFFPDRSSGRRSGVPSTASFCNNTCCVVLPHLVKAGRLGDVLHAIEGGGFRITAAEMFYMEQVNAEEFYEIYKGVVPEYSAMVTQLVSGPCVALEISGDGSDVPQRFRELVGPRDPVGGKNSDATYPPNSRWKETYGVNCFPVAPENTSADYFQNIAHEEMARQLRPNTLRARFGVDRVAAGLHCSDLPEDGPLEVEYFFKILQ